MLILGLSGSLRRDSYNRKLMRAAARLLPAGIALEEWQRLDLIPPYSEELDREPAPEAVAELRNAIAAADGVLIATPEYNASIPGQLKNALDWASRPFPDNALRGKPVAVIGASVGMFGAIWAQADLRRALKTIGADVAGEEFALGVAHEAFRSDGSLRDPEQRARLARVVAALVDACVAPEERAA